MIVKADKYEGLLKAVGPGAFSRLEYADPYRVVLRMLSGKSIEGTSTVKVYFNAQREQVTTGRLYEPMAGNRPFWFRPGYAYRIYTHVEIVKPIPAGIYAMVMPTEESYDHLWIASAQMQEGFQGPVWFMAHPIRRVEMEQMVTMANLVFLEGGIPSMTAPAKKPTSRKKKETDDADSVSDRDSGDK